jgi:hypothetical protein
MKEPRELKIRIHCHNLPGKSFEGRTGVRLGIQHGNSVVDDVPGDTAEVTFTVPLRVGENPKTRRPNFLGPYAHGTADERFIYLSWGERKGDEWEMFRRAKLLLGHIMFENIEAAEAVGQPIGVSIDMTDAKGGPRCASLKPTQVEWEL